MKPQNNKAIYRGYLQFSLYLAVCVLTGVLIYVLYTKTGRVEVERIVDKTGEYDKIYIRQNELANSIDSLYLFVSMFNTKLNDAMLMNTVSKRKQDIIASMDNMNNRDVRMYRKLLNEVNTFLGIKDSIRVKTIEEDMVKKDLQQCINDNKQMKRKMTIGGLTIEKK
ncbi:MAG: type VI secretion system transmembrane protein TssO [Prevotellaceae bacterium]|jgi:hypothetical protein|nr:type VI secretion system transmembrane protein TssO [Prevotellaceae bacterium]